MHLFAGTFKDIMNSTAFCKRNGKYIPCLVTNYYFSMGKFALVPLEDMSLPHDKRRLMTAKEIYVGKNNETD